MTYDRSIVSSGFGDPRLRDLYERAVRTPSDINEHLEFFVDLCRDLDATKVIELGTRGAVSTLAWLHGLQANAGHLWSVDIDPAPELPFEKWTFLQGDDLDPAVVNALPDSVDILFIDTSHAYQQTLAELNVYRYKVRPGGCILLHDTELRQPFGLRGQPDYPVRCAVEEFCREEALEWTNHVHCNGLGVISIP